MLAYKAR